MLEVFDDQKSANGHQPASESNMDFELATLETCWKSGDSTGALSIAQSLATAVADHPRLIERVSLVLEALGALKIAEGLIEGAILCHPYDLWIAVRYATIATTGGNLETAKDRWHHVINKWPNEAIGSTGLAALQLSEGNYEAAERLYRDAALRFPDNVWAADGVATVATTKRDWSEAVKLWADVQARFPDHSRAYEQLRFAEEQLNHARDFSWADAPQKQGNLIEAILRWQNLIERSPDWVEAYLRLAALNLVLGRPRRSVDALLAANSRVQKNSQIQLALLDAAWADRNVDLTLDTLACLMKEQSSKSGTLKHISRVLRELLDSLATFDAFRRATLIALSEPGDRSPSTVHDFIVETASAWPDRRTWFECVWHEATHLPEADRNRMPQLTTCQLILDRLPVHNLALPSNMAALRVIPLSKPIDEPGSFLLEALRLRTKALFAHVNAFVADRRLRRYQNDIVSTGKIGFGDLFGQDGLSFSGCLYYAPPKSFAYRFVTDEAGYWLITGLVSDAYRIVAAYDEATASLFYEGADATIDLKGFLGRQVHDIRLVASSGTARVVSDPKVILVSGFANYAHYMWNELPSLLDIEHSTDTKVDEIAVVYEPFGPFTQLVRWQGGPKIRTTSNSEIGCDGQFQEAFLFTAGSTLVTAETRRRLCEVCTIQANGAQPDDRGAFTVWISLRKMYRHATNMRALLASLIRRIEVAGLAVDVMLDGFSLPFDVAVEKRYAADYFVRHQQMVEEEARSVMGEVGPTCRYVRLLDATWATLPNAIAIAERANFYICHHGTQQHKIGWMYDIPGLIHGNLNITEQDPRGSWVQAQCDSPVQPDYFPLRFIGDAVTDNERQDISVFRDYQFIAVEECADFVFERMLIAYDVWSKRQRL